MSTMFSLPEEVRLKIYSATRFAVAQAAVEQMLERRIRPPPLIASVFATVGGQCCVQWRLTADKVMTLNSHYYDDVYWFVSVQTSDSSRVHLRLVLVTDDEGRERLHVHIGTVRLTRDTLARGRDRDIVHPQTVWVGDARGVRMTLWTL
jgi:hypothetical protein